MPVSHMTRAAGHSGGRRSSNSGTGTASMAPAFGSIGTGVAAPTVAATTASTTATTATAVAATAAICEGDVAGRQMTAKQCDGGSGQRRTNGRGNGEQLQPPWYILHDQFSPRDPNVVGCGGANTACRCCRHSSRSKLFVMWYCLPPVPDQIDRLKAFARELDCDEDEAAFDAALKKVAERARSRSTSRRSGSQRDPRGL
jgi:hypothetical protein